MSGKTTTIKKRLINKTVRNGQKINININISIKPHMIKPFRTYQNLLCIEKTESFVIRDYWNPIGPELTTTAKMKLHCWKFRNVIPMLQVLWLRLQEIRGGDRQPLSYFYRWAASSCYSIYD
jgi:hypothetical protein